MAGDEILGLLYRFNVPVVAFLCRVAKSEQPVIDQEQAFDIKVFLINFRCRFGQIKSGHDVRHDSHSVAVNFLAQGFRVGLIGDYQNSIGVGMVDKFMRQEGVQ